MTAYTEQEAEKIARYLDSYASLQAKAQLVRTIQSVPRTDREYNPDLDMQLKKAAILLRKQISKFNKEVPKEIRDNLMYGKTVSQLETLATNILLKD